MTQASQYTASQIAAALGCKRQSLARKLRDAKPDGAAIVRGNAADAWTFPALPAVLQKELETSAQRLGFKDAPALLAKSILPWQPAVPLSQVAPAVAEKAVKLSRALARMIERRNDLTVTSARLDAIGAEDYQREFGHSISTRAIRAFRKRTLDRDAGLEQFSRVELYLPDNPPRKNVAKPYVPLADEIEFAPLHQALDTFHDRTNPNAVECQYLWLRVFEFYEEKICSGKAEKKTRRALLKFLSRHAAFLVSSQSTNPAHALLVSFQRKYNYWLETDRSAGAVKDARAKSSGNFRGPDISANDLDKLTAHAVLSCGGRIAQAWRELLQRNELSETVASYYLSNPARKSYVPRRIADAIKYEVAMMEDIHHGPRQSKLNGAYISRDWNWVHSMDWFQADDFTMPVYFYTPDGRGGWELTRGQVLLMIDARSTCILGFVLLSSKNYNARAIRTLITKVADQHGLPRKGFYFERGIWEKSKLLKGDADACPLSWGESEQGLREFGLKFVHSNLPRSKPVERVGGAVQNMMEGLPGYIGRNEQTEKFERVQKKILAVNRGELHPSGHFLNEDEYCNALQDIFERYNADRQDGKMCAGVCPDEAFGQHRNLTDPPVKFSAECRYLLAHHKRPAPVTRNGVTLRFGKQVFNYRNVETGRLIGQRVLAWFNPEAPEILTVTDLNRQNPFCIARSQDVPAMEAPADLLDQELDRIEQHQAYAKARYRALKARYASPVRPMIADRATLELGAEIVQRRAAVELEQGKESRRLAKGAAVSRGIGLAISPEHLRRPGVVEAAEKLNDLLNAGDATTKGAGQ